MLGTLPAVNKPLCPLLLAENSYIWTKSDSNIKQEKAIVDRTFWLSLNISCKQIVLSVWKNMIFCPSGRMSLTSGMFLRYVALTVMTG